uniref:Uncharacterized protein n=1 Tax=Ciona intestinalis TaxID=7719 RepID=H2XPL2_CIOIN
MWNCPSFFGTLKCEVLIKFASHIKQSGTVKHIERIKAQPT